MAMMTANEIERYFKTKVEDSMLGQEIGGDVYRSGMRPDGSGAEDIIVKFLSGSDGQRQTGIVIVNVYVPDADYYGKKVEDKVRIGVLEALANELPQSMNDEGLHVWKDVTPTTNSVDDIKQHVLTIRLNFELITD